MSVDTSYTSNVAEAENDQSGQYPLGMPRSIYTYQGIGQYVVSLLLKL
jgi:hypothetical protein